MYICIIYVYVYIYYMYDIYYVYYTYIHTEIYKSLFAIPKDVDGWGMVSVGTIRTPTGPVPLQIIYVY